MKRPHSFTFFLTLVFAAKLSLAIDLIAAESASDQVRAPRGFRVTLFADDDLAHDIYSMTVDSYGRVVVSGRGYIRILEDRDKDGRADSHWMFADGPASGAQGLYFDGPDLLCTGDQGLLRFRDANQDGRADGPPQVLYRMKTGGEHDSHAVRKGPDGWWYLIAGNYSQVGEGLKASEGSPITRSNAGVVVRFSPDFLRQEIVTDGFRNAYDFAFSESGDIFVYDSDGERDVSLPWYRPTRVFHAIPGASAGWFSRSWKRPDYFLDQMPVIASFGRGSPTGVEVYRHNRFPIEYRDSVFVADWTFGRVMAIPLTANGSGWMGRPRDFLSGVGQFGFAPTDLAVAPDGALLVSVGGRGTRGGVYRVTYDASDTSPSSTSSHDPIDRALNASQPLSSWSRHQWEPLVASRPKADWQHAALDVKRSTRQRVRAIEIVVEHFGGMDADALRALCQDDDDAVRGRAAWAASQSTEAARLQDIEDALTSATSPDAPPAARAALESIARLATRLPCKRALAERMAALLGADDRLLRWTAARTLARLGTRVEVDRSALSPRSRLGLDYAMMVSGNATDADPQSVLANAARIVADTNEPKAWRLDAIRVAQAALGDVGGHSDLPPMFDGYIGSGSKDKNRKFDLMDFASIFPTRDEVLDYELARLFAMTRSDDPKIANALVAMLDEKTHPVRDIHFLAVLALLPPGGDLARQRAAVANSLCRLQRKINERELNQDNNWEPRIRELILQLARRDPELPEAIVRDGEFGFPGSVLLTAGSDKETRAIAWRRIRRRASDPQYPWNSDLVAFLAAARDPAADTLIRSKIKDRNTRSAVLRAIAKAPHDSDRDEFLLGLDDAAREVWPDCLRALEVLPPASDPQSVSRLLGFLEKLSSDPLDDPLRDQTIRLLRAYTKREFGYAFDGVRPQREVIAQWSSWFQEKHPELTPARRNFERAAALKEKLQQVNWKAGDAARGRVLFTKQACQQCHLGRRTLGPDLKGVTKRFSRDDVFTAIASPNLDVSPRYQTTHIQTTHGKTYSGVVIYGSVDGVTLRSGLNQTIRIEARDIAEQRQLKASLMPTGLIDGFTRQDLADLYAYLTTL